MPRRLARPDPERADDAIRLEPLSPARAPEFVEAIDDEAIKRFTLAEGLRADTGIWSRLKAD